MSSQRQGREERRRYARVAKAIGVRVRKVRDAADTDFDAESLNVGVDGLCLRFTHSIPVGTVVRINFTQFEPRGHGFEVDGRVIWSQYRKDTGDHHVGIQLIAMTEEQLNRLLLIVGDGQWGGHDPPPPLRIRPGKTLVADYRKAKGLLKGRWTPGSVTEVSLREMVLVSGKRLPPHQEMQLRLLLPDGIAEPLPCQGIVLDEKRDARPGEWDSVVRFTEITDLDRLRLAAFLSREVMM